MQFWERHFFFRKRQNVSQSFSGTSICKKKCSSLFSRCKTRQISMCTVKQNYKHISSSCLVRFNDNYFIYMPSLCAETLTTEQLSDRNALCCVCLLTAAEHGYLSIWNNTKGEVHSWKFVTLASRTLNSTQLRIDLRQLKWVTKIITFANRNFHCSRPL